MSTPDGSWMNSSTAVGTSLQSLLTTDEIVPGSEPSYQLCKTIYMYHPLGAKMVDSPIKMAQSQERKIAVSDPCETELVKAFKECWVNIRADNIIFNTLRLSRAYGISSCALLVDGKETNIPICSKNDKGFSLIDKR